MYDILLTFIFKQYYVLSTEAVAEGSSAPARRTRPVRIVRTARARPGPPSSDGADSSATPRYTAALLLILSLTQILLYTRNAQKNLKQIEDLRSK